MILSAQTIREMQIVSPFNERTEENGMTYGLGPAGYDIRLDQHVTIPLGGFVLASSLEYFIMPNDVLGVVHDKSTWVRRGICVQNTVIEPGWCGYLTLELTHHDPAFTVKQIVAGTSIAQVVFHRLDQPTELPYGGKYQYQERGLQGPR